MRALVAAFALALVFSFVPASSPAQAATCEFVLGFKAIHDMIPDMVGDCLVGEHHNPTNGDGLQETTAWHGKGGLLVWRKSDNWTAFTDGANSWVNGPYGLQKRPNSQRFSWEGDQPGQPPAATAVPPPPAPQCCKVCTTGKACGDSCISKNYNCNQPPGCACNAN